MTGTFVRIQIVGGTGPQSPVLAEGTAEILRATSNALDMALGDAWHALGYGCALSMVADRASELAKTLGRQP